MITDLRVRALLESVAPSSRINALLIAGAERLIVDAADEVAERDHVVSQAGVCR